MYEKLVFFVAIISIFAIAASAFAVPPFMEKQLIIYDGYLEKDATGGVLADTLFVVNNTNKSGVSLEVWIEVFDKHGNLVAEGTLYNGGIPLVNNQIPRYGYGWITLGMIVPRPTYDPMDLPGGEKFVVKIVTGKGDPGATKPTIVEVKQIIYEPNLQCTDCHRHLLPGMPPEDCMACHGSEPHPMVPPTACWMSRAIKSWAETCLGGKRGPGVVKHPSGW